MDRALDELMKENEDLKAENQRLKSILDSNMRTMDAMAEGMTMLSHPNWATEEHKEDLVKKTVIEWMTRSANERDSDQRSQRTHHR